MTEVHVSFMSAIGLRIVVSANSAQIGTFESRFSSAEVTPEKLRQTALEIERAQALVKAGEA